MLPGVRVRGPYERRDGRWQVDVREGDGSRRCRTFTALADGQEYADELLATVRATNPITIEDAIGEYERHLSAKENKSSSITDERRALHRFFPDRSVRLRSVSVSRARALYQALVDETDEGGAKALKAASHRKYLHAAGRLFKWCLSEGLVPTNPFASVRPQGRLKHGKTQHRVDELRLWEAEAWHRASAGDPRAVAALMALYLGLRATEVTLRVVRDVDDGGRILWIPDAKTPAGRRALDVPDVLGPMLVGLCAGRERTEFLFPTAYADKARPGGRAHKRDWVREQVVEICDAAGVPRVSAHAMRGALATLAAERGQLGHLAALHFGHTSVAETKQSYAAPGSVEKSERERGMKVLQGGKR